MSAPLNNEHNLKWTDEKVIDFINDVYNYVLENKDCNTLTKATLECGQYEQILRYFKSNKDVDFAPIKKAKDIIKDRIIDKGLKSDYNPTMSIFVLKNNHDMKDKQEFKTEGELTLTWNETKTYKK